LGRIALVEEEFDEAKLWLQESVGLFREVGQKDQLGNSLASLGHVTRAMGDLEKAQNYLREALRTALEIGALIPLLFAIPLAALLAVDRWDENKAIKLYVLASRFSFVKHSHWFNDVFERHIPNLTGVLPLKTDKATQEEEKSHDLWVTAKALLVDDHLPEN
jgi:tetratricopeptide (TPR) repeat protein